jgi:DNA-binding transcriptional LysR family regulator
MSGVSAQMRQLEHELGATLIDRSGRTATVTVAGAAALEHARAVLASVAAVRQAVDDVNGLVRGRLLVGMVMGCQVTPLFDALAAFRRTHPGVEVALFEENSERLIESVREGSTDMALVGVAGATPAGLGAMSIVSEGLVAAVPAGRPLTRRRRVKLADVARYPVVCLPPGTGIRSVFDQACAAKGAEPVVAMEASAPGSVADLAVRGLGVGILSASMVSNDGPLKGLPIVDVTIPALLALVWPPAPSPALRELLVHSRKAFGRPEA